MIRKKQISMKVYLLLLIPILLLAYYLSGLFLIPNLRLSSGSAGPSITQSASSSDVQFVSQSVSSSDAQSADTSTISSVDQSVGLLQGVSYILTHFYRNWWNDKTPPAMAAGVVVWAFLVSYLMNHYRNFQLGKEYGSEDWAKVSEVDRRRRDPDPSKNRILSRNLAISLYGAQKLSNNNMLVIGSSGTYKTNSVVTPNLLKASANFIVLDVKGELMYKYGNYLSLKGYTIRCLNLKEPDQSCRYNPFEYIEREEDLIRLISNIQDAVNPPDAAKGDPFWQSGPALYLQALFYYEWDTKRREGQVGSMNDILALANMEMKKAPTSSGEEGKNPPTQLQLLMQEAAEKYGEDWPAVRDYRKLKEGATETVRSIIIIVNAMLKLCEVQGIRRIFEADEMKLREFATGVRGSLEHPTKNKMALFLIIPDNDQSFNYIVSMLYTQAFDILMRMADTHFRSNGGALPIPIEFWMDEFYAGARPYKAETLMGVVRSRNISMIPILQSVAQLKALFPNDRWQILTDNCAVTMFLGAGSGAAETHEYITKLLGKMTIDTVNDGSSGHSSSVSYNKTGRDLMSPSEVRRMPRENCIIIMEGEAPIYDRKALPWEMPEDQVPFREAMMLNEEGGYQNPVRVVTDPRSGQLHTLHEDKKAFREVGEGEVLPETKAEIALDSLEFLMMNFRKAKKGQENGQ